MELILLLWVAFFALQTTCSSLQIQVQSLHQEAYEVQQLSLPTLPRKLIGITEEMSLKENVAQNVLPNNQQSVGDDTSGKGNRYQKDQAAKHGKGGTWQEWAKGTDPSQFFTMDYTQVRGQRPIHNNSPPVSP
ncbi:hypothetical protein SLE2022_369870 [Rubroshorea leprosula]